MATFTARLGTALFRIRSFSPLPVLAGLAWLLWRSRLGPGPRGGWLAALDFAGIALAFAGEGVRFYTLGQVPEGTSGQGSRLEAKTLNTQGPYAYVRNPLYVGNLGICLGLMLLAHDVWILAVGLAFFFFEYFFIIRAEEAFLRSQFGDPFDAYCARVRRWIPRATPAFPGPLRPRFDWWRALKKEHNPFAAWASGALALLAWEAWARGTLTVSTGAVLAVAELCVLAAFVGIKSFKRGWLRASSYLP